MKAVVERGFIRPEDALAEDIPQANGATTKTEKGIHSAAWLESLTAHRSAALTATLTQQRDVAVNVARLRPFFRQHIDLSQAVRIFGHDEIRVLAATLTFPRSAFSGRPRSKHARGESNRFLACGGVAMWSMWNAPSDRDYFYGDGGESVVINYLIETAVGDQAARFPVERSALSPKRANWKSDRDA